MTAPSAEFAAQVAEAVDAERVARIDSIGRQSTIWLAAAPLWTLSAAKAAGFPEGDIFDFVKRARDAGWCETRGSLREGAAGELRFWMPDEVRRTVLGLLMELNGREEVQAQAKGIAARVNALSGTAELPGALQYWADLMRGGSGPPPRHPDAAGRRGRRPECCPAVGRRR